MSSPAWIDTFPALQRLPADTFDVLAKSARVVAMPAGSRIFGPGHAPDSYLLLLDGTVRVQQASDTGREIVLYRVAAGESCALTTACLMAYEDYSAEAVAETDVRAVAIPRQAFDMLIAQSAEFRRFVFTAFSRRVTDLFHVIEDVAFARMDIRLAEKLLALSGSGEQLAATQQQLAAELGTAREVVSRLIAEFHRRGWVASARGSITIKDRAALDRLARHP